VAETSDLSQMVPHVMVDFNQMKTFAKDPLILVEGNGIRVIDSHGHSYIDGISGVFAVSLGHSAKAVTQAMAAQLNRLAFASPIMSTNERALELVGELIELTGGRMQYVKLLNSGSEATEAAMKMARQHHRQSGEKGRYKIVSFYQSYHGATLGALSATGWPKLRAPYEPLAPGFIHVRPPICQHEPGLHDPISCALESFNELRDTIEHEGPETVAAVIVEPVMLTAGVHVIPIDYLKQLRAVCDELGVLLIFDEIVTGFGRLGSWFAAELFDVWPDLMCVGKGISSGYAPLSAVLLTARVGASFWGDPDDNLQFQAGHTHAANPVSAAAGLATIRAMKQGRVFENVAAAGRRLATRLAALEERCQFVGAVRGLGLLYGIGFVSDRATGEQFSASVPFAAAVQLAARKRGLLMRASPQICTLAPPLVTTIDEIDEIADILDEAVDEVMVKLRSSEGLKIEVGFGL
jgi:adenosylmethionine-8-amino-7-oxononanoate aminotransferase